MTDAVLLVGGAAALDAALGEPPNALHPVVWIGAAARALERIAPRQGAVRQLAAGAVIAAVVPAGSAATTWWLLEVLRPWPIARLVTGAILLKTMFAARALGGAARVVRDALAAGRIGAARRGLASLCSRDPSALDEPAIAAAAIESVAENTSDSVVAPLLAFAVFGVPGAVFYRAANTLDAMIGYHGRYEHLGKAAARLDDLLNLVPARVTAALLLLAGAVTGADARRGARTLARDGAHTESPNAGRPMAAMAGLLRVQLEKRGHYRLGDPVEPVGPAKIDEAWRIARLAGLLAVVGAAALAEVTRVV